MFILLWNRVFLKKALSLICVLCILIIRNTFFADKLDGIRPRGTKRKSHESPLAEDFDDDPYDEREEDMRLGKKRVSYQYIVD